MKNDTKVNLPPAKLVAFCLFLLAATTAEAAHPVNLTESERAWLQEHPTIRWGMDPQWPPFSYLDKNGNPCGISADFVRLLAQKTGLKLQFVRTESWTETERRASSDELDFVGGIARTEERERSLGLAFTQPFCTFPTAIVTRKDLPFVTMLGQLETKLVALPRGYATTEELQKLHPKAHIVLTDTEEQSVLMVSEGQADATVLNLASACHVVHKNGLTNLKISGFSDIDFFLTLGVRKGAPELRSILEKGLASIRRTEKEQIYAAYIIPETRSAIDWRTWRRVAIYSILAALAVTAAVLAWNQSLRREIHRRYAVETALSRARDALDVHARELERRAGEMQILNDKLTSANKDLEAFSSTVSHDLKSPLRRLRSFADLIELQAGGSHGEVERKCVEGIQQESQRMAELIEALLEFARLGKTEIRKERVDLDDLTREVIAEIETETNGREILWEVSPLPNLECDRALIKQVLANLLGNAAKFTRKRNPARIQVGTLPFKPEDREVVFYVKDNGAGFDQRQAGSLFETFRRLHRGEEYEGTGLGLANVKRIIERHGGWIRAEGEVDKGATFFFSLPATFNK